MDSTFENTVLDFDLNLLHQTKNNTAAQNKLDKQRNAILHVKKKTITTDKLVNKYHEIRDLLHQTEKRLVASKEDCKQICIDYASTLAKCTKLENDAVLLQNTNQDLVAKAVSSENRCEAIQSHCNQLELLIKENKTLIETMKTENLHYKATFRTLEKKNELLKNEKDTFIKDISVLQDVVAGNKKLSKKPSHLLDKYKKLTSTDADYSDAEMSCDESEVFATPLMSPFHTDDLESINEKVQDSAVQDVAQQTVDSVIEDSENTYDNESISRKDYVSRDLENSLDVASVDTGRGSSLAFSDSDKCFHSPDYYINDSPLSTEIVKNKEKPKQIDTSTSPMTAHDVSDKGTSPIIFEDNQSLNRIDYDKNENLVVDKSRIPIILIDKALSPISSPSNMEISTGTLQELSASPIMVDADHTCSKNTFLEKECLESNNSIKTFDDNSNDFEIAKILNKMRLNHELITPIPLSPAKLCRITPISLSPAKSCSAEATRDASSLHPHNDQNRSLCQDSVAREQIKAINAKIDEYKLEKERDREFYSDVLKQFSEIINHDALKQLKKVFQIIESNAVLTNNDSESGCSIVSDDIKTSEDHREKGAVLTTSDTSDSLHLPELMSSPIRSPKETEQINETESNFIHPAAENTLTLSQNLQIEDDSDSNDISSTIVEDSNIVESEQNLQILAHDVDNVLHRKKKAKKLTRLDKIRKVMLPKSKIKRVEMPTLRKSRIGPWKIPSRTKKISLNTDSTVLNNKVAYENAVKIMTELKYKKKHSKDTHHSKTGDTNSSNKDSLVLNKSMLKEMNEISEVNNTAVKDDEKCSIQSKGPTMTTPKNGISTRSRSKHIGVHDQNMVEVPTQCELMDESSLGECVVEKEHDRRKSKEAFTASETGNLMSNEIKKRRKRASLPKPEIPITRMLRSSALRLSTDSQTKGDSHDDGNTESLIIASNRTLESDQNQINSTHDKQTPLLDQNISKEINDINSELVNYGDIDLFAEVPNKKRKFQENYVEAVIVNQPENVLCMMIEKYAVENNRKPEKKVSDAVVNSICEKIEESMALMSKMPAKECYPITDKLLEAIRDWHLNPFLKGFIKYLKDPMRKTELFSKVFTHSPLPSMTKSEQILLYLIDKLKRCWPQVDIVNCILDSIEYTLFQLNNTPDFDVIESMSHFYAVLCRYYDKKSRLRLFILDAMYCIQFKSVALTKQCLEVWMHILPLSHMGIAKNPLVTCLVYLLYFYKCEDKFNRVQDMRNILNRKYSYPTADWNETKVLEMFKNSILEIRDIPIEKKMLKMALIILAKRHGPRWCQKNIVGAMLQPMIEGQNTPDRVRLFCVSMIGPLLKPYPVDMKLACEVATNQLLEMMERNPSQQMAESILTSLINLKKHSQDRLIQKLFTWKPKQISPYFEDILRDYVEAMPLHVWKKKLSKVVR